MSNVIEINTDNNVLIAEFIDMQKTKIGWYDHNEALSLPNTIDNTFDYLLFNKSWDWLMPVVQMIKDNDKDDLGYIYIDAIDFALMDGSLDGVYETVVEFIKWYNKNK